MTTYIRGDPFHHDSLEKILRVVVISKTESHVRCDDGRMIQGTFKKYMMFHPVYRVSFKEINYSVVVKFINKRDMYYAMQYHTKLEPVKGTILSVLYVHKNHTGVVIMEMGDDTIDNLIGEPDRVDEIEQFLVNTLDIFANPPLRHRLVIVMPDLKAANIVYKWLPDNSYTYRLIDVEHITYAASTNEDGCAATLSMGVCVNLSMSEQIATTIYAIAVTMIELYGCSIKRFMFTDAEVKIHAKNKQIRLEAIREKSARNIKNFCEYSTLAWRNINWCNVIRTIYEQYDTTQLLYHHDSLSNIRNNYAIS